MKKGIVMAAILLMAVALCACSANGVDAFTLEKDMGIEVNGTWYPIYEDAAPLLAAIGGEYELYAAPSCLFVGEDKEFAFSSSSVFTNPDNDKDIWYIIELHDNTYATARGIRVGSTKAELIDAYGDGYYMESDYQMTYSVSGVQGDLNSPCIIFDLEDDTVSKISIYYPTNMN